MLDRRLRKGSRASWRASSVVGRDSRVRFTLSEAANVTVSVASKRTPKKLVRRTMRARAGTVTFPLKRLLRKAKSGSYRVTIEVVDAGGNRARATKTFRLSLK